MINSIELKNIRCFEHLNLSFDDRFTYIHGDNGSGKTTILEAIHMISNGRSHRTTDDKLLITDDAPFGKISLSMNAHTYEVVLTHKGKRVWINHQEIKKLSQFVGRLKSVLFSPEDIQLVKGAPQFKRQFLDVSMMQIDPIYIDTLNTYKKLLKQRNALLKKIKPGEDKTFLNVLSEQLVTYGTSMISQRQQFITSLNEAFKDIYRTFNDANVKVLYKPNVNTESLNQALLIEQDVDIMMKTTTSGPHRDDIIVLFNGSTAKDKASQGQQRLLAVVLKLAVLHLIKEKTKQPVVLLLDDVLSELDEDKQQRILSFYKENQQTIINSAHQHDVTKGKTIALKGAQHE